MEIETAEVELPPINREDFAKQTLARVFGEGNVEVAIMDVSGTDVLIGFVVKHDTLPTMGGEVQVPFNLSEVEYINVVAKIGLQVAFQFSKQLEAQAANDTRPSLIAVPSSYKES